jgi:hypothetical protein
MSERKTFIVRAVTAADCLLDLPALVPYASSEKPIDLFVTAKGFEERVLAFPRRLGEEGRRINRSILAGSYHTNESDNEQRYAELRPLLEALGAPIVDFDADDPLEVVSCVEATLGNATEESPLHVVFDVSGASSTLILAVMAALTRAARQITLTVLYATADVYDVRDADSAEPLVLGEQREEGVGGPPLSVPFAGHHHDHLPGSVIALPSMYTGRLEACLAHLSVGPMTGSPDNLYWLLPSTGAEEHKWRQDDTRRAVQTLMRRLQGREEEDADAEVIRPDDMATSDVLDYAETMRLLVARIDSLSGRNISIVHMGSKLQAVGVSLAAAARGEVAVLTARPAAFNAKKYSSGVGSMHALRLPDLGRIVRAIADIGTLKVENP